MLEIGGRLEWYYIYGQVIAIILKLKFNCSDMTNFGINCSIKKNQRVKLEVSEVLITLVTIMRKARVMLHTGASHSNNHQVILKLIGQYIFCNNLQRRKI